MKSAWLVALRGFLLGEASLQILNALTGILLVRWMTVEQYAQYAMANAFQSGAQQFVEFGLGGSIVALIGKNISNKERLGRLVAAGFRFRQRMVLAVGAFSAVAFPLWFAAKGWTLLESAPLAVAIIAYLAVSGLQTYYRPPLVIHREMGAIYGITIVSAAARLLTLSAGHFFQILSASFAAIVNVAALWISGLRLKMASAPHLVVPEGSIDTEERELRAYIRPIIPGVVFAAIQGQLAVLVAAAFGQAATIAEVGALARLSLLLGFFSAANGMLISPLIARQHSSKLLSRYLIVTACCSTVASILLVAGFFFPAAFLALLGPNYTNAGDALPFMVANTSLGYLNGVFWTMNNSRKWVFWWMPVVSIPGAIGIQALGIWLFDVSTATGVFQMLLLGSSFVLLTRLAVAIRGFSMQAELGTA